MSMIDTGERRLFKADAVVALGSADDIMKKLCDHFSEHGTVTVKDGKGSIVTDFGTAFLETTETEIVLGAEATDETGLAYIKLSLAEHILAFAAPQTPRIVWDGDGKAGSPLPYFREMRVISVRNITPHMRRITLSGDNLKRFEHGGLHVRLLLPPEGVEQPLWPVTGEDGRPLWPSEGERPIARVYTIRSIDAQKGEVEIDFVLHEGSDMPGAEFAAKAQPGDVVGMTGPGGGIASEADWYLLAGDETALPAIGRILASLPSTAKGMALIEVADPQEQQELPSKAAIDIRWLHRNGKQPGTTTLLEDAVRDVIFPGDEERLFVWAGCEFKSFRAIRNFLRKEKKLPRDQHLVVAYWRREFAGDNARQTEEH